MLRTYTVTITATDSTEVDAHTDEEALELANGVFMENEWEGVPNAELDIQDVRDYNPDE